MKKINTKSKMSRKQFNKSTKNRYKTKKMSGGSNSVVTINGISAISNKKIKLINNAPKLIPMFLGCTITCIKKATNVYTQPSKDIIVVSTCFFIKSNFDIDDKTFKYIDELIANIESFQMKINRFTTNPTNWIYRVYIDETILKLNKIINKKFEDNNLSNSNIKKINDNIIENKNKLLYIYLLLTTYIDKIIKSQDDKYKQIEIYTYSNDNIKYKLISNNSYAISGHIATFGTLMRYHPLTDSRIGYCIMRNCSTNLGPLDIMIQNYWINIKKTKYMEYKLFEYSFFNPKNPPLFFQYGNIYRNIFGLDKELSNNIRVAAGLISVKLDINDFNTYIGIFEDIKINYIDNKYKINDSNKNANNNYKYVYGIDELLINKIFPDLEGYTDVFSIKLSDKPVNSYMIPTCDDEVEDEDETNDEVCKNCMDIITDNLMDVKKAVYCGLPKLIFGEKLFNTLDDKLKTLNTSPVDNTKITRGNAGVILRNMEKIRFLDNQYVDIYSYIGTKLLYNINTFPVLELPEMAILKSFDYKIKYQFISGNIENIYNVIIKILLKKLVPITDFDKMFEIIYLDVSTDDKIPDTIQTYMSTLEIAFLPDNFKPLVIYPKEFNLYTTDGTKQTLTIKDLVSGLPHHNLTFELEDELETLQTIIV